MNLKDIKVKVDKPYPEIEKATDDPMTVAILKNLISRPGELGAILQYVYQSVVADKTMEEIGGIIEEIGIVEMIHLDLLMHAVTDFGGVPKYEDSQGNYFSTNCINYTTKLKEMLDNNIRAENMAINSYREAIKRVKNESLKNLFSRIIEDEEQHIKAFQQIRDNVRFLSI